MKKIFLINWIINLSVWAFIYFFKSFVIWELTNPFQWIIEIPIMKEEHRFCLLSTLMMWQGIQIFVIQLIIKNK